MKTSLLCGMFAAGMLLFGAVSAVGQPPAGRPAVTVESDTLLLRNGRMYMRMTYRIRAAGIGVEEGLLLTPVLHAGGRECRFAPLLVNGRRRARRYARSLATDPQHTGIGAGAVVTAGRAGTIAVACAADVPFEEWMRSPELQLEGIVCGCADRIRHIAPVSLPAERTEIYRSRYRLASPPSAVSR